MEPDLPPGGDVRRRATRNPFFKNVSSSTLLLPFVLVMPSFYGRGRTPKLKYVGCLGILNRVDLAHREPDFDLLSMLRALQGGDIDGRRKGLFTTPDTKKRFEFNKIGGFGARMK